MNRFVLVLVLFLLSTTNSIGTLLTTSPDWHIGSSKKIFSNTYFLKGIDYAVIYALEKGNTPELIIKEAKTFERLNPVLLIRALYCAGADGDDIREGAQANGVSDLILESGFKASVVECIEATADSQVYIDDKLSFFGSPKPSTNRSFASPSTFE